MSQVVIPMSDYPAFTQNVVLDGNTYRFSFSWNGRGEFWSMDIADANNIPLLSGIRLVILFPLLAQHKEDGLPAGQIFVLDTNPNTAFIEPGRHDFTSGRKLQLIYWSNS